jgi:hypothetical protein
METSYWLTPVGNTHAHTASEIICTLVVGEKIYAFREQKRVMAGDWICFYAKGNGIVAHARILTKPEHQPLSKARTIGNYPWVMRLEDPQLYQSSPVVIDLGLRSRLDAFKDHLPNQRWAWFVQSTHKVSRHDFELLTRINLPWS